MNDSGSIDNPRTNFLDILRVEAATRPERRCFTFLREGPAAEEHLTLAALDLRARAIAAHLQRLGATGGRAFLFHPPGLEFIASLFGCFYAGVTAIPAYPPRANRSIERLQAMAEVADASVVLTTSGVIEGRNSSATVSGRLEASHWVGTDKVADDEAEGWIEPQISPRDLAVLQFTSGSTEAPKGVMISHANLVHNSALIGRAFGHSRDSVGVIWLPPFHDMGLIGGILQPLFSGFTGVLLAPVDFVRRPIRWLEAISRYRASSSGGPNFAYDLCVRSVRTDQVERLDLSSWEVAFTGAEPIHAATLDRFAAKFAPCGFRRDAFYPCYGLAEATLIVSGGAKNSGPKRLDVRGSALEQHEVEIADALAADCRSLVSCGAPLPSVEVRIVDPATGMPRSSSQIGEVWVAGPSVAQGYWRRPDETAQTFDASYSTDNERYLCTGDLGFLKDGELFITGRVKDLIIVRGRNHYPQDIERIVETSHQAIRRGHIAAFSVADDANERLIVVAELERGHRDVAVGAVGAAVRRSVAAAFGLEVDELVLIHTGTLLKTSSGKIQRAACRAAHCAGELDVVGSWDGQDVATLNALGAPRTVFESQLATIWSEVLGREGVGIHDNFFDLGGASIQVVQVIEAAAQVGIPLNPEMFFEHQTIADLASAMPENRDLILEAGPASVGASSTRAA